ncbi:MAG: hypothetical protein MHPSP_003034 [Paramarteilia canceri]
MKLCRLPPASLLARFKLINFRKMSLFFGQDKPEDDNIRELCVVLNDLIKDHRWLVFLKGTPEQPRCGFSQGICQILAHEKISFDWVDMSKDAQLLVALKAYSKFPTLPQLWVDQKFIGGFDVTKTLWKTGELKKMWQETIEDQNKKSK